RGSTADQGAGRRATKTTTGSGARSARGDSAAKPGQDEAEPTAAKRPAGSRKAKPVMPSWEDVLLGVKRS
ncbi:MAG TPA: hypothetical protein VK735_10025, partial [Pseudonocardia sp.]|nr:hypothetical protein [Pseudonocardia sp.]